jgi:mono/diheme cytochrome c family protein
MRLALRTMGSLLLAALGLAACAVGSAPAPQASLDTAYVPDDVRVQQGRRFAERACARCHAIGTESASPNSAAPPFSVLAKRYSVVTLGRKLDDIATGHYEMPPTRVSDDEIAGLTAYLERLADR